MTKIRKQDANALATGSECPTTGRKAKGRLALRPEVNSLLIVNAFKKEVMGEDVDLGLMMDDLEGSIHAVKAGDLSHLEAMLLGQATALQTLFTTFAIKASRQQHVASHQIFMTMAFKAQAQSRATLQTLVELKTPRQPTFVKQANIAHGPQQVNNGAAPTSAASPAKKQATRKNKLLEPIHAKEDRLVAGAKSTPSRADPAMATLGSFHGSHKRSR